MGPGAVGVLLPSTAGPRRCRHRWSPLGPGAVGALLPHEPCLCLAWPFGLRSDSLRSDNAAGVRARAALRPCCYLRRASPFWGALVFALAGGTIAGRPVWRFYALREPVPPVPVESSPGVGSPIATSRKR